MVGEIDEAGVLEGRGYGLGDRELAGRGGRLEEGGEVDQLVKALVDASVDVFVQRTGITRSS